MWLHEVQPGTKEADELARKIMTSLAKAWAWDHGIEAEVVVRRKDQLPGEGDGIETSGAKGR